MDKFETIQYRISVTLKIMIGFLVLLSAFRQELFLVSISLLVLLLTLIPTIVSRSYKINLPIEIDLTVTVLLYLHFALGEYSHFYVRVPWWDIFLHFGNSIILGLIGFVFAYSLLLTSKISAKPILISLFSLTFSVFIGVLWEIFEFFMDYLFGFTMQKSGLVDTMTDLMVDVAGALIVSAAGFFYLHKKREGLFSRIVKRFLEHKYF
ncbi:MAG: hypothetical protein V3574_01685 [Candidatus Moraniibacteriota bacterium]